MKAKKMTVRKIQKEAGPSSMDQEAPNINQVWIVPLELVLLHRYTSTQLLFPCLLADIVDISSGEEKARQEVPTLDSLENPVTAVNLQDLILETPENLATTINTLVNLQELQESIITSSAINPSPEKVHLQEPIVTSSAINPSPEKVRYIFEPFASSFSCTVLIFCLLSGSKPLGVALI
jgi:hypothetical protein